MAFLFCKMPRNNRRKCIGACCILGLMLVCWQEVIFTLPDKVSTSTTTIRSTAVALSNEANSTVVPKQEGNIHSETSESSSAPKKSDDLAKTETTPPAWTLSETVAVEGFNENEGTSREGEDDPSQQQQQKQHQYQESHIPLISNNSESHPREKRAETATTQAITIVIQLSGEMANNLQHIAHGVGLQLWTKQDYGIDANIVLRHFVGPNNRAPKPKWKSARNAIRQCFPNLAHWDFEQGNSAEFNRIQAQQQQWLGGRSDHLFGLINSPKAIEIKRGLDFLVQDILPDASRPVSGMEEDSDRSSSIRIPYLYSQSLDVFPLVDKYYKEFREMFVLNQTACCVQIPEPDELVFHFRNYQYEMPGRRAYDMGFGELSPDKTARELFAHLLQEKQVIPNSDSVVSASGSRVAITSRIRNQAARNYVVSLERTRRIASARLVTNQTDVQDFCFLVKAQAALLGHARSTFVFWAALIGNASTVRLYNVDDWGIRKRHSDQFVDRFAYNWSNPLLQDRIRFELYQSEEMEHHHRKR